MDEVDALLHADTGTPLSESVYDGGDPEINVPGYTKETETKMLDGRKTPWIERQTNDQGQHVWSMRVGDDDVVAEFVTTGEVSWAEATQRLIAVAVDVGRR